MQITKKNQIINTRLKNFLIIQIAIFIKHKNLQKITLCVKKNIRDSEIPLLWRGGSR